LGNWELGIGTISPQKKISQKRRKGVDKPVFPMLCLTRPGEHGYTLDFLFNALGHKPVPRQAQTPFPKKKETRFFQKTGFLVFS